MTVCMSVFVRKCMFMFMKFMPCIISTCFLSWELNGQANFASIRCHKSGM